MHIAFHELGDLKTPIGEIHDKDGKALLEDGEIVLFKEMFVSAEIRSHRRSTTPEGRKQKRPKCPFLNAGSGTLYRTDRRLIYLRVPNFTAHIRCASAGELDHASARALSAKDWVRKGWKEGFSVPMSNIKQIKRRKGRGVILFVKHKGLGYKISLKSPKIAQIL